MPTFLFSYRMPADYQPGPRTRPRTGLRSSTGWATTSWTGASPCPRRRSSAGADGTRLGGYSLISAEDLEAAVTLAKDCPALAEGAGVQVGQLADLRPIA